MPFHSFLVIPCPCIVQISVACSREGGWANHGEKLLLQSKVALTLSLISDTSRRLRLRSPGVWLDKEGENRPPLNVWGRSLSSLKHLCSHSNTQFISIYIQAVQLRLQYGIYIVLRHCTFEIYTYTHAQSLFSRSRAIVNSFCLPYGKC